MNAYTEYHVWNNGKVTSRGWALYSADNLSYPESSVCAPGIVSDTKGKKEHGSCKKK